MPSPIKFVFLFYYIHSTPRVLIMPQADVDAFDQLPCVHFRDLCPSTASATDSIPAAQFEVTLGDPGLDHTTASATDSIPAAQFEVTLGDPGLDHTWHVIEMRLFDSRDAPVGASAVVHVRAGLRTCSHSWVSHVEGFVQSEGLLEEGKVVTCLDSIIRCRDGRADGSDGEKCTDCLALGAADDDDHVVKVEMEDGWGEETVFPSTWADDASLSVVIDHHLHP
jgi:hypothetical protein